MNDSLPIKTDVAIVGGGMAGAALALALAKNTSLTITVIEPRWPDLSVPSANSAPQSRVVALNKASLDWLMALDIWPALQSYACDYAGMAVWDGEGTGEVAFDAADIHATSLGSIIENHHVVRECWLALQAHKHVNILAESVVSTGVVASNAIDSNTMQSESDDANSLRILRFASGAALQAQLVIAADGAQSVVRDAVGINSQEREYDHHALVATVKVEKPHNQIAYQRFSQTGPLAFLPLNSLEGVESTGGEVGHYCSIVWSQKSEQAAALANLNDVDFMAALQIAIESRLGKIERIFDRKMIPLAQRHASSYVAPMLALVGDAAHTLHPLAGQGVNLSFADAKALFDEVSRAEQRQLPVGHQSVLRRYQRQRRTHNAVAIAAMKGFKELFELQHPAAVVTRNMGMRVFDGLSFIKRPLMRIAAGDFS